MFRPFLAILKEVSDKEKHKLANYVMDVQL